MKVANALLLGSRLRAIFPQSSPMKSTIRHKQRDWVGRRQEEVGRESTSAMSLRSSSTAITAAGGCYSKTKVMDPKGTRTSSACPFPRALTVLERVGDTTILKHRSSRSFNRLILDQSSPVSYTH